MGRKMGELVSLTPSGKVRGNGPVPLPVYSSTFSGKETGEAISLILSGEGGGILLSRSQGG